ncbi:MAG: nucleotidyltransferase domain-containing protein [bacterium]
MQPEPNIFKDEDRLAYVRELEQALGRIVDVLSSVEEVERVSLFGSYARGRADLFTDLDILVVMDTDRAFLDRLRYLYGLLAVAVDVDILCYTPREFQTLKERPFLKRILQEEKVLYEKKRT